MNYESSNKVTSTISLLSSVVTDESSWYRSPSFFGFISIVFGLLFLYLFVNNNNNDNVRHSNLNNKKKSSSSSSSKSLIFFFLNPIFRLFWNVKQTYFSKKSNEAVGGTVKVYILLGQSNMVGEGEIDGIDQEGTLEYAVKKKNLYQYLIDSAGNWVASNRVRNVRVMDARGGKMGVYNNEFMQIIPGGHGRKKHRIGPEFGIGHILEEASSRDGGPIMILKSCIGNRSLGWDLLPPGSKRYEYQGKTYAGYKESPAYWDTDTPKPEPKPNAWYAGKQYDDDVANAKTVLSHLETFYPTASTYEIAGFFWWQGDKDRYIEAHAVTYQRNLVRLIKQLRQDFNCKDAKFVMATLGQTDINKAKGTEKLILDAMLNVDGNAGNYPEFVGNVSTVYSHPLSKGGASNAHYNGNAETYMNIGEAMGNAMAEISPSNKYNNNRNQNTEENELLMTA